jgi:hypothetical protein
MTDLPLPSMKLTPHGWPQTAAAYLGCVSWALQEDGFRRAFQAETGLNLDDLAGANGAARLIDEATGRTQEAMAKFLDFITREVWGQEDAA